MAVALTPQVQAFLKQRVLGHLGTLMKDGSPHVTPVWMDTDGTHVLVNTSEGRIKTRNMRRDARVAISINDPVTFQKMVVIRGRVVSITTQGANEHMSELAMRYSGHPYHGRAGDVRVKVAIEPTRVLARGL